MLNTFQRISHKNSLVCFLYPFGGKSNVLRKVYLQNEMIFVVYISRKKFKVLWVVHLQSEIILLSVSLFLGKKSKFCTFTERDDFFLRIAKSFAKKRKFSQRRKWKANIRTCKGQIAKDITQRQYCYHEQIESWQKFWKNDQTHQRKHQCFLPTM